VNEQPLTLAEQAIVQALLRAILRDLGAKELELTERNQERGSP
jgi:hypothetical protein